MQAIAAQYEQIQAQLTAVERQIGLLEQRLMELHQARTTLEALEGDEPLETLVPVGGGVQVRATIDPTKAILVPLGASYSTEGDLEQGMARLKQEIEQAQNALAAASQQTDGLNQAAQQLMAQAQAAGGGAA